jgi:acetamidase/formamidase
LRRGHVGVVLHPGALFGFGDGHAAMADGEVTQTGLETSMAVDFSVEVIKGYQTQRVREEDNDYIISFGVAGSSQEALKVSTAQLATWIKHDYGLSDSEVALLLGAVMKIEVPNWSIRVRRRDQDAEECFGDADRPGGEVEVISAKQGNQGPSG